MSKQRDRSVSQRRDGQWQNRRNDALRASSLHESQGEAVMAARRMLINQGGGELTVFGRDHKIRSKDTIGNGNDPVSIKDREH